MRTKFGFLATMTVAVFFLSSPLCQAQTLATKIEMPIEIIKHAETDGSYIYFLAQYMDSEALKFGVGVIDVRNPLKPVKSGYAYFYSYADVTSFVRIDKTIFVLGKPNPVAGDESRSLVIAVDMSNPALPRVTGSLKIRNTIWGMRIKPHTQNVLLCSGDDPTGVTFMLLEINVAQPAAMKLQTSTANEDIFSFYQPAGNFFALSINNSSDGEHPDVRLTLFDSAGKQLTPTPVKMPESVGWTFNDYLVSGNKIYGLIRGDGAIGYIVAIDVTNPVKPQYSGLADMYQAFADDSVFDAVLMNGYIYLYSTGTVNDKYFDLLRKIKADAFAGPDIVRVSQAVLPEFAEGSWVVAMLTGNNVLYVVTSSNGILVYKP